MLRDTGIREKISDYLVGAIEIDELEDAISAGVWDRPQSPELQPAYDALRLIAEAEAGEFDESELRRKLSSLAGIVTDSPSVSTVLPSMRGEQFLEKLTVAEAACPRTGNGEGEQVVALMRFAGFGLRSPAQSSFGKAQPNDRGSLHRSGGETHTQSLRPRRAAVNSG
jgi:hypothetical protein